MRMLATIGSIAALTVLAASAPARAQAPPGPATVAVSGMGVVRLAPDLAFVVFVTESRNERPAIAQRDAAEAMRAVEARLRQAGLAADALRTLSYDLSPEYEFVENRRRQVGYIARNRLEARIEAVDRVGELIDAGVGAGATSIEGLRFDVKDRAAAERDALRAAVADAWARAQAAAAGVGRTVDRVIRIQEPGVEPIVVGREPVAMRAGVVQGDTPPPIVPGDVEIRARVTLTAEIR